MPSSRSALGAFGRFTCIAVYRRVAGSRMKGEVESWRKSCAERCSGYRKTAGPNDFPRQRAGDARKPRNQSGIKSPGERQTPEGGRRGYIDARLRPPYPRGNPLIL